MDSRMKGILFSVIGLGIFIFGVNVFQKAKASENWPSVQGTVTNTSIDRKRDTSSSSNRRRSGGVSVNVGTVNVSSGGRSRYKYTPKVTYSYNVGGQSYSGNKIAAVTQSYSSQHSAQEIINKYPISAQIKVYYNPNKASDSVLQPGVTLMVYFPMIFGLIFTIIGVVTIFKSD